MASRMRQSTARATPSRPSFTSSQIPASTASVAADELPPYKKPSHPLTTSAQDQIKALNGRPIDIIKKHVEQAETRIADVAGTINDKLREHEEQIAKRRKLWETGTDTEKQEDEEAALKILQSKVDEMTNQLEESMRSMIDSDVAAKRIEESLSWLHANAPGRLQDEYATQMSQFATQRQSRSQRERQAEGDDEDGVPADEGPTPGPTPLDGSRPVLSGIGEILGERLTRKKNEYTSQSLGRRYAENPAYASFKGIVHDAKYQDDRPLPNRETWFTEAGRPAPGVTGGRGDDDDDDIVMDRATISTRCPLTFQRFKEPLTSTKCPHTFEKNAILEMIRSSRTRLGGGTGRSGSQALQCPVSGCNQMLTRQDLREDPILIRKLQRMMRAEKEADEESETEDVEEHESRQPQSSAQVKDEPSSRQQPPQSSIVEDLGSPSGSEDEDEL